MRTTVTLDPDVERLIREKMLQSREGFKKTLNDAVRQALRPSAHARRSSPFVVKARPMGILAGIDSPAIRDLDTDVEIESYKKCTSDLLRKK